MEGYGTWHVNCARNCKAQSVIENAGDSFTRADAIAKFEERGWKEIHEAFVGEMICPDCAKVCI